MGFGDQSALPVEMSNAAPPLVLPVATVSPLTVTLSRLIFWSPDLTDLAHSSLPSGEVERGDLAAAVRGLGLGRHGGLVDDRGPVGVGGVLASAEHTGPGSLIVQSLAPESGS